MISKEKYVLCVECKTPKKFRFFLDNEPGVWNYYGACFYLGELTIPEIFIDELSENLKLMKLIREGLENNVKGKYPIEGKVLLNGKKICPLKRFVQEHPDWEGLIQEVPELSEFVREFNASHPQTGPAPDPAPADSGQKKKRKKRKARIVPPPNLLKEIGDYAARNPGATQKDLQELFGISAEQFRKGHKVRKVVYTARGIGDLGRHAAKPDNPFDDEN